MAASTPERVSVTQPAALLKGHLRKPSTKVIEAQQSLRTGTTTTVLRDEVCDIIMNE